MEFSSGFFGKLDKQRSRVSTEFFGILGNFSRIWDDCEMYPH